MDSIYQGAFVIALKHAQQGACRFCLGFCGLLDFGERGGAIDLRLAASKQV
jgi:hypothetical protein